MGIKAIQRVNLTVSILLLLLLSSLSQATHFRFGHVSWEARPDVHPYAVDFKLELAYRWSYFDRPEVGQTFQPDGLYVGDGRYYVYNYEVIAINESEDWMIGRAVSQTNEPGVVQVRYSGPTAANGEPWVANVDRIARIAELVNSSNSPFRVEAKVDLSIYNRSPRASIAPIVTCPRTDCTFIIPAIDKDGDRLRFRLAEQAESKIEQIPAGIEIDPESGVLSWANSGQQQLGLYAVQVIIEDLDENGEMKSSVAVDFIINLQEFDENTPPNFDVPPTPENNSTIIAIVGRPMSFNVQATDRDARDRVSIGHVGLPIGAALVTDSIGVESRSTFTWTPAMSDLGEHLITVTANDDKGSAALPHTIRVRVIEPGINQVRVVDSISTVGIDPDLSSFSVAPDRIEAFSDYTEIEWNFITFEKNQVESLSLDLVLTNLQAGETKTISHQVLIEYLDANGSLVTQTLPQQSIIVGVSSLELVVGANKHFYLPDETVSIVTAVTNLGAMEYVATVALDVVDVNGNLVADLGRFTPQTIAGGQTIELTGRNFEVGSTIVGTYLIRAQLINEQEEVLDTQLSEIRILAENGEDQSISSHVFTDKVQYEAWGRVSINGFVGNQAENAYVEGAQAQLDVRDWNGVSIFAQTIELGALAPNAQIERQLDLQLNGHPSGLYSVSWVILDQNEMVLSSSRSLFTVVKEASQSLLGQAAVEHTLFYRDGLNTCHFTLANRSPEAISNIPVRYGVYDMNTAELVMQSNEVISLPSNAQNTSEQIISGNSLEIGSYVCNLSAEVDGEWINLASAAFDLREPPVQIQTQFSHGADGRLLVLMDEPRSCSSLMQLHSQFQWDSAFDSSGVVTVRLYSADNNLVDEETIHQWNVRHNSNAPTENADIEVKVAQSGEIEIWLNGIDENGLADQYQIELEYQQNIFLTHRHQWGIETHCDRPLTIGEIHDDMHLLGYEILTLEDDQIASLEPFGPVSAPDVLQQTQYLIDLLNQSGLTYTLVHTAEDFLQEMQGSDYSGYAILSERPHISLLGQKQVREEIFSGKGLLVAGPHDKRHFLLENALGVSVLGRHPWSIGLKDNTDQDIAMFGSSYWSQIFRNRGAETQNNYILRLDQSRNDLVNLVREAGWLDLFLNYKRKAITTYDYGYGKSIFMGFDALSVATELDGQNAISELLINGLSEITRHSTPVPKAYREWPINVSVENQRAHAEVTATLTLPTGVSMIENPYFSRVDDLWIMNIHMQQNQVFSKTFYVTLPSDVLTTEIQLDTRAVGVERGEDAKTDLLTVQMEGLLTIQELVDESLSIKHTYWYLPKFYGVHADILFAERAFDSQELDRAKAWLISATNKLLDDERVDVVRLRTSIDEQIRILTKRLQNTN